MGQNKRGTMDHGPNCPGYIMIKVQCHMTEVVVLSSNNKPLLDLKQLLCLMIINIIFLQYTSGKMVRVYKKKTDRDPIPASLMQSAVKQVIEKGFSVRSVANDLGIPRTTLLRYVQEGKKKGTESEGNFSKTLATRKVFSADQERSLKEYLVLASKHHGLTKKLTRELAWEYAKRNGCTYPPTWDTNKCAGEDWMAGFMKQHNELSCHKPEATSLSRSTSFNKKNVNEFFDHLEKVSLYVFL
jgi:transposase-like protein